MYKILIADDNPLIRMGLVNMIQWESLPLVLAGTAENGQQALELCENVEPDILITDIEMPKKDGLYLMNELQRQNPSMQIIVVSAYDDFAYAKEAMKAGSLNYILKPVNPEELMETIKRAVAILEAGEDKEGESKWERFRYGGYTGAAEFPYKDMQECMKIYYSSAQSRKLSGVLAARLQICDAGAPEILEENQKTVKEYLKILMTFSPVFFDKIRAVLDSVEGESTEPYFDSCEELLEQIEGIVDEMCQAIAEEDDNGKKIAYALKRVIDHNYQTEISLESLAEIFNYTPAYISKVFKKEIGCNLTRYVNDIRIQAAEEQLLHSNKKIMRIAEDVGFRDYIYFTKQFKKYTGLTPGSFRKQNNDSFL